MAWNEQGNPIATFMGGYLSPEIYENSPASMIVSYRGGLPFFEAPGRTHAYYLLIRTEGFYLHCTESRTGLTLKGNQIGVLSAPWNTLDAFHLNSGQATRAHLPALAAFGVLGLATRREPGTYLEVSVSGYTALLYSSIAVHKLRVLFLGYVGKYCPQERHKFFANGSPLAGARNEVPSAPLASVSQRLRDLTALHEDGLISDEEFAKKAKGAHGSSLGGLKNGLNQLSPS